MCVQVTGPLCRQSLRICWENQAWALEQGQLPILPAQSYAFVCSQNFIAADNFANGNLSEGFDHLSHLLHLGITAEVPTSTYCFFFVGLASSPNLSHVFCDSSYFPRVHCDVVLASKCHLPVTITLLWLYALCSTKWQNVEAFQTEVGIVCSKISRQN